MYHISIHQYSVYTHTHIYQSVVDPCLHIVYLLYVITYITMCAAGIGPWKVAMLSAVLMLWDIMWWAQVPMNSQDWIIKVCGSLTYHMFVQMLLSYFHTIHRVVSSAHHALLIYMCH